MLMQESGCTSVGETDLSEQAADTEQQPGPDERAGLGIAHPEPYRACIRDGEQQRLPPGGY